MNPAPPTSPGKPPQTARDSLLAAMNTTNNILLKARPAANVDWRKQLTVLERALEFSIDACFRSVQDRELYCYLSASGDALILAAALESRAAQSLGDPGLTASAIAPLLHRDGPAQGGTAAFHYTVETDVDAGPEQELNDWYNTEHLPGLAAVPGCIAAARYRNLSHAPRYLAAYDLTEPATLERPEWLAVRNTAWSSRVRPHFRNPKRTLFRREPLA